MGYPRLIPMLFTLTALAQLGSAQQSHGYGFLGGTFGGRGGMGGAFRLGIGGEVRLAPMVALGGEVGTIHKDGAGVIGSGNASVHVPVASRTVDPFVTGGFSLGYLHHEAGLWVNLGGGLNYWFRRNVGLRAEFRGYPGGVDLNSFAELRVGVCFR